MTENGKKILNYFSTNILVTKKIDDDEFDALIDIAVNTLLKRALEKTLLDEDECKREPEVLFGSTMPENGLIDTHSKIGKDKLERFSPIIITILNFTQDELVIYKCIYDPINEVALNECTWTYFYKEIVSLETIELSRKGEFMTPVKHMLSKIPIVELFIKSEKKHVNDSKEFILTTRSSSVYRVELSEYQIVDQVGRQLKVTRSERTIRAIRSALRDKQ